MLHVCFGTGKRGAQSARLENSVFFSFSEGAKRRKRLSSVLLSSLTLAPDLFFAARYRKKYHCFAVRTKCRQVVMKEEET